VLLRCTRLESPVVGPWRCPTSTGIPLKPRCLQEVGRLVTDRVSTAYVTVSRLVNTHQFEGCRVCVCVLEVIFHVAIRRKLLADVVLVSAGELAGHYSAISSSPSEQECVISCHSCTRLVETVVWQSGSVCVQHGVFKMELWLCIALLISGNNLYRWIQPELERCSCISWSRRTSRKLFWFHCCSTAPRISALVSKSVGVTRCAVYVDLRRSLVLNLYLTGALWLTA
jgi:hypothetical protein